MGERALLNRVRQIKELEENAKQIEKALEELRATIKADMEEKNVDELAAGDYIIRFKEVTTNRFDTKAFSKEHGTLYNQYLKASSTKRFTISA